MGWDWPQSGDLLRGLQRYGGVIAPRIVGRGELRATCHAGALAFLEQHESE